MCWSGMKVLAMATYYSEPLMIRSAFLAFLSLLSGWSLLMLSGLFGFAALKILIPSKPLRCYRTFPTIRLMAFPSSLARFPSFP